MEKNQKYFSEKKKDFITFLQGKISFYLIFAVFGKV